MYLSVSERETKNTIKLLIKIMRLQNLGQERSGYIME